MASSFEIVPALEEHARLLAPRMRPGNVAEIAALGLTPLSGVLTSLALSDKPRTAIIHGEVAAMWGVVPVNLLGGVGAVWLVTSDTLDRFPLAFLRRCRSEVRWLLKRWPVLMSAVDGRYTQSIQWAKWLGFDVSEIPGAIGGLPFYPIRLVEA